MDQHLSLTVGQMPRAVNKNVTRAFSVFLLRIWLSIIFNVQLAYVKNKMDFLIDEKSEFIHPMKNIQ